VVTQELWKRSVGAPDPGYHIPALLGASVELCKSFLAGREGWRGKPDPPSRKEQG